MISIFLLFFLENCKYTSKLVTKSIKSRAWQLNEKSVPNVNLILFKLKFKLINNFCSLTLKRGIEYKKNSKC